MRQRLHIARGLLHDPPVVFLDEPTIGVDPVGARELRATIAVADESGKTVLLTTHYMFEADALCDRIAVIANGQIVGAGNAAGAEGAASPTAASSRSRSSACRGAHARAAAASSPACARSPSRTASRTQLLIVQTGAGLELTHAILSQLDGASVGRVSSREPTLEDAYVALVTAA